MVEYIQTANEIITGYISKTGGAITEASSGNFVVGIMAIILILMISRYS